MSVKKEWVVFHKKYFNVASATITHAKACYDFFRRQKNELANSSPYTSDEGVVESPLQENKNIVFPKLEKIENSIVIINSRTDNFEIEKISNVLKSVTEEKENSSYDSCEMKNSDVDTPNPRTVANPPTSKVTDVLKTKNDFDGINVTRDGNFDIDSSNPSTDIPSYSTISKKGDGCETFTVAKNCSVTLESKIWQDLFDGRITSNSKENNTVTVTLPPDWTSAISKALSVLLPYCCLNFKRHKLYKNSDKLFKCWYFAPLKVVN